MENFGGVEPDNIYWNMELRNISLSEIGRRSNVSGFPFAQVGSFTLHLCKYGKSIGTIKDHSQ